MLILIYIWSLLQYKHKKEFRTLLPAKYQLKTDVRMSLCTIGIFSSSRRGQNHEDKDCLSDAYKLKTRIDEHFVSNLKIRAAHYHRQITRHTLILVIYAMLEHEGVWLQS
jgi:hypothetical protein